MLEIRESKRRKNHFKEMTVHCSCGKESFLSTSKGFFCTNCKTICSEKDMKSKMEELRRRYNEYLEGEGVTVKF